MDELTLEADLWLYRTRDALRSALHDFGYYNFMDKGPSEVMLIHDIQTSLKKLSPQDAGNALTALARTPWEQDATKHLAYEISLDLQDWDELFEHPNIDEFFR